MGKNDMMLVTFKDIANIDNITYAGFKADLKAKDEDKFSPTTLKKELERYKNKKAFK